MDITKIKSTGYNITYIAQPGEHGPRVLFWDSPFNREATAAIKASFTAAQWETIRLWGRNADAYLVAAVNAFAAEDPRILCTLCPSVGITRKLLNNGNSWAVMPEYATDFPLSIEGVWSMNTLSGERDYFGNWNNGGFEIGWYGSGLGMYANSWWTPHSITTGVTHYVKVVCTATQKTQTLDDDFQSVTTNNSITSSSKPALMAGRENGYSVTDIEAQWFKIVMNGREYWLVPFLKPDTQTVEWRDLNTGDYLERHGAFSIVED